MRENPVKREIATGGVSLGTMAFEFNSTGLARLAAGAGAEFIIFDQEHTGWSVETIRTLVATAGGTDLVPMVRVPTTQYHLIARVLDVGVRGIMVPMVEDGSQAKLIADSARYPPVGRRGAAFGVAHDDYAGGSPAEKM
ncbi:MAG: aldolase/citrate lyase family protein, partial [Chloroflexota bacterium]